MNAVCLNNIQKQHDTMTDLEFCNLIIFEHILQLVSAERPHPVSVLSRMLGYYLGIELIELNEVWVSEAEILEQLRSLELPIFE